MWCQTVSVWTVIHKEHEDIQHCLCYSVEQTQYVWVHRAAASPSGQRLQETRIREEHCSSFGYQGNSPPPLHVLKLNPVFTSGVCSCFVMMFCDCVTHASVREEVISCFSLVSSNWLTDLGAPEAGSPFSSNAGREGSWILCFVLSPFRR